MAIPPTDPAEQNVAAALAELERRQRVQRCEAHAADVLAAAGRMPSRAGLWVTVVVHEREGVAAACVSTCLTPAERGRLGEVLEGMAATCLDEAERAAGDSAAGSPWGV